jgi:hypothetical protein
VGGFFGGGGGAAASNMVGATSSAAGTAGLVPAPAAGKEAEYLSGDATFLPATTEWIPTTRKVKSGELNFFDPGQTSSGKNLANNYIVWGCVYIPKTKSCSTVGINVTSAASNSKIKIGLYSVNTSGDPDILQFETGEINSATTGVKTISITSVTLNAGWYYSATRSNGSPFVWGVQAFFPFRILRGLSNVGAGTALDYSTTTYANALPNPWSGTLVEGGVSNPAVDVF